MTLLELIQKHSVSEEVARKIIADMAGNSIYTSGTEDVDSKYTQLDEQHKLKIKEHDEATKLIAELEKVAGDKDVTAEKLATYKAQVEQLQAEKIELELDHAIKFELLAAGAKPADLRYLMFEIKDGERDVKLDAKGKLKGLDVKEIQTAYPSNFAKSADKKIAENKLPGGSDDGNTVTKEQLDNMGYQKQLQFKQANPELYEELTK